MNARHFISLLVGICLVGLGVAAVAELPSDSGYVIATWNNPSNSVSDFTGVVDLSRMPQEWWDNVTGTSAVQGRVANHNTGTELAADWIDFDDTAETGLVRFYWGTVSSSGKQQVRIYPPRTGNTVYLPSNTYGSDNAYDANTWGYWPLSSDVNDRTENDRTLTKNNALQSIGGETGQLGDSTLFDDSANDFLHTAASSIDWGDPLTLSGWFKVDDVDINNSYFGKSTFLNAAQFWYDNNGTNDRVAAATAAHPTGYGTTNPGTDWTHVAFTQSGDIYVNGVHDGTFVYSAQNSTNVTIGRSRDIAGLSGYAQHCFVATTTRSADWIELEYDQTDDNAATLTGLTWHGVGRQKAPGAAVGTMMF